MDRRRLGEAGDQQWDDVAAKRLHHIGDRKPEGTEHEQAAPGDVRPGRRLMQRAKKPSLGGLDHPRHSAESNDDRGRFATVAGGWLVPRSPWWAPAMSAQPWPSGSRSAAMRTSDRKSTRLHSSHLVITYAVFCLA